MRNIVESACKDCLKHDICTNRHKQDCTDYTPSYNITIRVDPILARELTIYANENNIVAEGKHAAIRQAATALVRIQCMKQIVERKSLARKIVYLAKIANLDS